MPHWRDVSRFLMLTACLTFAGSVRAEGALTIFPPETMLHGRDARQRLIVTETLVGRAVDRTRVAAFRSETPAVVLVSADGVVTPVGDGEGVVTATVHGTLARATFRVSEGTKALPVHFEPDVQPVLARYGCNAGACHGKQRGQNGFQLSLLGFDADFDYAAIAHEARGRRVFPAAPEQSLFLTKPSGRVPHGGGKRLDPSGPAYDLLLRWLVAGMPRRTRETPSVERISVEPVERILAPRAEQPLVVTAHFSDGSRRDVTHLTTFQSNESVYAAVDDRGLVRAGPLPGAAAVMARYAEKFAVFTATIPMPGAVSPDVFARLPRNNFIDGHVWTKLQQLGITPSAPAGDATYLRRAHIDVIGRLPTPDEVRAFLADTAPDKRARLVERLLQRPEYADHWANKWADLLRPNPYRVGIKAVFNLDGWLRDAFRRNKPYDQFVREIVTAQGSTFRHGPTVIFRDRREPAEQTTLIGQLFLGIRLDCARCHHHPFEVWGQDEFYRFAAYFARIGRRGQGLSEPISGGEEVLFTAASGQVTHPTTGRIMEPRPLFGSAPAVSGEGDPRQALADWMTAPQNPYFARVIVNRVWADLMGRGLVEPVDDLRATNPPSNGPLLEALADDFRQHGHDLKHLLRTILASSTYALGSVPNERNAGDHRYFARHYRQRLRAEVLLDAVGDVTGVPESLAAMPPRSRAVASWTVRNDSVFLDSFGRPDPNQDPPCERGGDTTVVQALHLMNSPGLQRKVTSDEGRAATLAASAKSPSEIVEELYCSAYGRLPTESERAACVALFKPGVSRRQAVEDLTWALLNTPEFLFKD